MKIALASDLHLEFGSIELKNTEHADLLILGGDVCVAEHLCSRDTKFFENVSPEFPEVLYIMGNHEHYHGDFLQTYGILTEFLKPFNNVRLLEKEIYTLNNKIFAGCTLWSDFYNADPVCMNDAQQKMNDFNIISCGDRTFLPQDAYNEHKNTLNFIEANAKQASGEQIVIVGHHAPSFRSVDERYKDDDNKLLGGAYASNLEGFIAKHPNIVLWTHGHMHIRTDYMIGGCRVIANARGYRIYEPQAATFKLKYLEV